MTVRGHAYAVRVGGANVDGAWRGMGTIIQLIDPRPCIFQPAVYGRLIYTVMYMSDRLLTQANPNLQLPPPPELRRPGCPLSYFIQSSKQLHLKSYNLSAS